MNWFFVLTFLFIIVSIALVLVILVQRPQGGGLAGAFGGAAGGGADSLFGGRVGDALTWSTIIGFGLWLLFAVGLNMVDADPSAPEETAITSPDGTDTAPTDGAGTGTPASDDSAGAPAGGSTPPPSSGGAGAPAGGTPPSTGG